MCRRFLCESEGPVLLGLFPAHIHTAVSWRPDGSVRLGNVEASVPHSRGWRRLSPLLAMWRRKGHGFKNREGMLTSEEVPSSRLRPEAVSETIW